MALGTFEVGAMARDQAVLDQHVGLEDAALIHD